MTFACVIVYYRVCSGSVSIRIDVEMPLGVAFKDVIVIIELLFYQSHFVIIIVVIMANV